MVWRERGVSVCIHSQTRIFFFFLSAKCQTSTTVFIWPDLSVGCGSNFLSNHQDEEKKTKWPFSQVSCLLLYDGEEATGRSLVHWDPIRRLCGSDPPFSRWLSKCLSHTHCETLPSWLMSAAFTNQLSLNTRAYA